ncbi:flagellar FliJ protein [Ectothiorhodospira mobilis]|uniref:Flagellar FliJ protein n=1 Tax=Ectothiorhodospira mobilis TaxID=195064 RepID=A0A1I4QIB7_ECTMO|nr:flagellar export protein FliJ [Ectothiorhodospira mobilis]SFM39506.1 flagellar FliJ protein [Ectothiorhodospira mobilis]
MNRSRRMEPVVRLADHRQQDAARQLGGWQRTLEERLQRLHELCDYRDEYARRFQDQTAGPMTAVSVRDYRIFLERLNTAIEQQDRLVAAAREELERSRGTWVQARGRTEVLTRLVERFRQEERHEQERREQAEQDDRPRRRGPMDP